MSTRTDRDVAYELMKRHEEIARDILKYAQDGRNIEFIDSSVRKTFGISNKKKSREPSDQISDRLKGVREVYAKASSKWSDEDKQNLIQMYKQEETLDSMSKKLGRQPTGIKAYIDKLRKEGVL